MSSLNWAVKTTDSMMQEYPLLAEKWAYEWAVVLCGVLEVWRLTGEARYFDYIKRNIDHFVTPVGEIRTYRVEEYNIDNIDPGKLLFPLLEATGDTRYEKAIFLLREQLKTHPRLESGGFWHKQIYPYQMWLDGAYMAAPFYAQFAVTFDEPTLFEDIIHQLRLLEQQTRDSETGLLYHGWDESKKQEWAEPTTGRSPHFWGRAMGWYLMALVDVMDFLPPEHPDFAVLCQMLQETANALLPYQDEATGLWYQILDHGPENGNYLETSAACMFVYALAKGFRKELLSEQHRDSAERAYAGLLAHKLEQNDQDQVLVHGICGVAGLGGTPYRDGSFAYYINEPVVTNDYKGVGAFILASAEMAKLS
jgi:unsaturated rhamnogalacturonyl hydrolase